MIFCPAAQILNASSTISKFVPRHPVDSNLYELHVGVRKRVALVEDEHHRALGQTVAGGARDFSILK